ncbi:MAG: homoserine O-acetyltransferase, partial [Brachybacterium tyrofermentans]
MTALGALNRTTATSTSAPSQQAETSIPARQLTGANAPDLPQAASTGAWTPEQGVGERRFASIGSLELESGTVLEDVTMAYETWGTLDADGGNAILVLHALTGDSHVRGGVSDAHPSPGWWEDVVGPGLPIDTERWFVIAPNIL